MTERFEKAYNALVKAYFEGTLAPGNCLCCAVGNICADAKGIDIEDEFKKRLNGSNPGMYERMMITLWALPLRMSHSNTNHPALQKENAELESLTNYKVKELNAIEDAFESNTKLKMWQYNVYTEKEILEDQFNGLSAVVDVMVELDNIENDDKRYNNKLRKHPKLISA